MLKKPFLNTCLSISLFKYILKLHFKDSAKKNKLKSESKKLKSLHTTSYNDKKKKEKRQFIEAKWRKEKGEEKPQHIKHLLLSILLTHVFPLSQKEKGWT